MNNKQVGIGQTVEGFYKVSVVDADQKVIWESPEWKKNLILNLGMDMIAGISYSGCFMYAYGGTGTRENRIDGQNSTITQVGTTATLNPGTIIQHFTQSAGGYNHALEVGDVLVYTPSNTQVNVVSVSDLTATVDVSAAVLNESFTIWKTSQTGLQNPISAAGAYNGSSYTVPSGSYWLNGFCGYNIVGNVWQLYRTYDFGLESSLKNYTEIGVGKDYRTWVGGYCFSRILLDTPVAVDVGQRLRVAYQLNVAAMPSASVYLKGPTQPIITNWPVAPATNTNATESLQGTSYMLEVVTAAGDPGNGLGGQPLDPVSSGYQCYAFISTDSRSLASFGSIVDRSQNVSTAGTTRAAYPGAGSYYCDKIVTFGLTQANRNDLRSMGLGYSTNPQINPYQAYCMLFEQSQSKSNVQTLTLSWRFSWGRTLVNGAV